MVNIKNISYIILFLFASNFMNMESRLILLLFLVIAFMKEKGQIKINQQVIILVLFSCTFYAMSVIYHSEMTTYYILPYLIGPFMGYICGYTMMKWDNNDLNLQLKKVLYILIFGRFFHGFLNFYTSNGYENVVRNGNDFWTKSVIAATGQGALMTMMISLLFYSLFVLKKNKKFEKYTMILCVYFAILNNIKSASRTALIIMILVFVLCLIYTLFTSQQTIKKKIIFIFSFLLCVMICFTSYNCNLFNIKVNYENSALYERINKVEDYEKGDENRKEMYIDSIKIGLTHPFGDGTLNTAHNFWLDILKQTGWIPFLMCVWVTVNNIKDLIYVMKSDATSIDIKYLLLSINTAILMNFAVEPIMKGMPYYFVTLCIIAGAINNYKKLNGNEVKSNE